MESLDLTKIPPRSPYVKLAGLLMLARTIDKMRAMLPGGNLGAYQMDGFSERMLETLGIPEDDMRAVIALAANDDEVVAWFCKHSDPAKYDDVNATLQAITVGSAGPSRDDRKISGDEDTAARNTAAANA